MHWDGVDGALSEGGGNHQAPGLVFWSLTQPIHAHITHTHTEAGGGWRGGEGVGGAISRLAGGCS